MKAKTNLDEFKYKYAFTELLSYRCLKNFGFVTIDAEIEIFNQFQQWKVNHQLATTSSIVMVFYWR